MASSASHGPEFPSVVMGNPESENVIVFLAGFPDDETSSFCKLFDDLKQDYYLISLCLPGLEKNAKHRKPWGYHFEQLLLMLDSTIERLSPRKQVYLMIHDWGAFMGLLYHTRYPHRVKKIIALDVGIQHRPSPVEFLYIIFYQWAFAFSYFVSQAISLLLGNAMYFSFCILLRICPFLSPCPHDKPPRDASDMSVEWCYLYYHFWSQYLTGTFKSMPKFPTVPILFMYGRKKNCMFHSQKFLQRIDSTPGSRQLGLDCGHWLQHYESATVLKETRAFLTAPMPGGAAGAAGGKVTSP